MPLMTNEISLLLKIVRNMLESQSEIARDFIDDKQTWDEINIDFKNHMLENLEEAIYRNMGVM